MGQHRYQDLEVWQYSMNLAVAAYKWTESFPRTEQYGLTSQLRRAAVSIPCNIAEGQGRAQPGEFLNQLSVARGSLQELETLLLLAERLGLLQPEITADALAACDRASRMLSGLRRSIRQRKASMTPASRRSHE